MNARGRSRRRRNAADETQVNRIRAVESTQEYNAENDLRWVMSDARGRRIIADLIENIDTGGMPLDGRGRADPVACAFQTGVRQVSIELNHRVREACPDEWARMQAEIADYERSVEETA